MDKIIDMPTWTKNGTIDKAHQQTSADKGGDDTVMNEL